MRCIVCALNAKYIHSALAPWCLKDAAERLCVSHPTVQIVEGTVNEPLPVLLRRLASSDAELIGFSCYIWNIRTVLQLVRLLRAQKPNVGIFLGGPEVSFRAEALLNEEPAVDFIISGEGELPFAKMLDAYPDLSDIPGISYRTESGVCTVPAEKPQMPLTHPDTEAYIAALHGRIAYAETSRGCPFSCAFCLSGRADGVRFLPMDETKQLLLRLGNSGTKTVKLIDRTFNCNAARAYEIISFLIDAYGKQIPADVCYHFEVGADLFDEKTLELLCSAPKGLFQIEAGMQSFHAPTLAAVSRKTDAEKLERNLQRLIRSGKLHVHTDLIAGLPHEDFAEFGRSFNRAFAMHPNMLQLGFLKLLYGSRLRREAPDFDCVFDEAPPYEIRSNRWLSEAELKRLHAAEDALERLYNSGRFRLTVYYLLKRTQYTPFDLFCAVGDAFPPEQEVQIPLDAYTAQMFAFFQTLPNVRKEELRDVMVCDRLRTVNTGRLPECLHQPDDRLKALSIAAKEKLSLPKTVSGCAHLHGFGDRMVAADYTRFDRVSGCYALHFFAISDLQKSN